MRKVLLFSILLWASSSQAQYFGVITGVEMASWNEIVGHGNSTQPAEFIGPGYFAGAVWAPEDSARYFRLEVAWEHQEWQQRFEQSYAGVTGGSRVRTGKMNSRLEIARVAPRVVFPLSTRVSLSTGICLGFVVAARTTESASIQTSVHTGSPSNPGGTYTEPADTSYTSTKGLGPYAALELGLEVRVWKGLSLGAGLGMYSTYVGTSQPAEQGPPLCSRAGLLWRF